MANTTVKFAPSGRWDGAKARCPLPWSLERSENPSSFNRSSHFCFFRWRADNWHTARVFSAGSFNTRAELHASVCYFKSARETRTNCSACSNRRYAWSRTNAVRVLVTSALTSRSKPPPSVAGTAQKRAASELGREAAQTQPGRTLCP